MLSARESPVTDWVGVWAPFVPADGCSHLALITQSRVKNSHQPASLSSHHPSLILLSFLAEFTSDGKFFLFFAFNFCHTVLKKTHPPVMNYSVFHLPFVDSVCVCVCVLSADEVTMEEVGQDAQLRAGELIIIVVVLVMWAGNVLLRYWSFIIRHLPGRQYLQSK